MLKNYIVINDSGSWNNLFIVYASNSKDAINKVWERFFSWRLDKDRLDGYKPVYKKNLRARSLDDYYKDEKDMVVCLN